MVSGSLGRDPGGKAADAPAPCGVSRLAAAFGSARSSRALCQLQDPRSPETRRPRHSSAVPLLSNPTTREMLILIVQMRELRLRSSARGHKLSPRATCARVCGRRLATPGRGLSDVAAAATACPPGPRRGVPTWGTGHGGGWREGQVGKACGARSPGLPATWLYLGKRLQGMRRGG